MLVSELNEILKKYLSIGFHEVEDKNIHGSRQFISDDKKICLLITAYSYSFIFRTIHGTGRLSVSDFSDVSMNDIVEYYKLVLFDLDYRNHLQNLHSPSDHWIKWDGKPIGENL